MTASSCDVVATLPSDLSHARILSSDQSWSFGGGYLALHFLPQICTAMIVEKLATNKAACVPKAAPAPVRAIHFSSK